MTSKIRNRLTSRITNDRITCITGTVRFSNIKCFDNLANTIDVTDITEETGLLTVDGLTSWLTPLTLQTLRPVVLELTVLVTFNGLLSLLTLLIFFIIMSHIYNTSHLNIK